MQHRVHVVHDEVYVVLQKQEYRSGYCAYNFWQFDKPRKERRRCKVSQRSICDTSTIHRCRYPIRTRGCHDVDRNRSWRCWGGIPAKVAWPVKVQSFQKEPHRALHTYVRAPCRESHEFRRTCNEGKLSYDGLLAYQARCIWNDDASISWTAIYKWHRRV